MKKLIYHLPAILIVSLFFASCSSTIMKRHYRKGYFVVHTKHKTNKEQIANTKTVEKSQPPQSEINAETEHSITSAEKVEGKSGTAHKAPETSSKTRKSIANAVADPENVSRGTDEGTANASPKVSKRPSLKGIASSLKDAEAGVVGTALSLMWIVILILVIAYLIGLFGVADAASGGWIHILGIAAVVLLILWLLRIV